MKSRRKYASDGLKWVTFDDEYLGDVTIPCECGETFEVKSMNLDEEYPCPHCGLKWKMGQSVWVYPVDNTYVKIGFQFIEIDALACLEEEFTQKGRPYPAYLMRKVLDTGAPDWRNEHPQYKKMEAHNSE